VTALDLVSSRRPHTPGTAQTLQGAPARSATITTMKENAMTEVITVSGRDGAWRVVEDAGDRLVLERIPQRTAAQMRADHGLRELTPEEFQEHFGHLPTRPND